MDFPGVLIKPGKTCVRNSYFIGSTNNIFESSNNVGFLIVTKHKECNINFATHPDLILIFYFQKITLI